ncbi:MAG: hypothetical protein LUQ65_13620, partial [Candidatus Helarchaeota archaeon]|nr:hypothetical protein [Candidatus Helarchaeota archaeon]
MTGVIGQNENGEYVQYTASKGVLLAPGDYARDPEMMGKLFPLGLRTTWDFTNPNNT